MFDPTQYGFHNLDISFQTLQFFAHRTDLGATDNRLSCLTIYLTQDGDFITVWHGLLDASVSTSTFADQLPDPLPEMWDFHEQYDTPLFRGHIKDDVTATVILDALRLDTFSDQKLSVRDGKLCCELMTN